MSKDSLVNLDPIAQTRKRQDSVIGRLFKTRHYGGKGMGKQDEFGHYLLLANRAVAKLQVLYGLWSN